MTLSEVAAELRDFKNRVESFFTGAEAKEGLSKATAQIAAFEQKLSAAQAQTANITTLETNHAQAIAAKDKEIADLKAKHVSDLAAKDAEVNLKAGTKAVEMVAKTGAQPVKEELLARARMMFSRSITRSRIRRRAESFSTKTGRSCSGNKRSGSEDKTTNLWAIL